MKTSEWIIIVAVLSLGIGLTARFFITPVRETAPPLLAFNLPDVSGKQHSSDEWQHKIRIINFWATWCEPCRKEIPEFIALQDKYATHNVQFIGIAIDDQTAVSDYLKTIAINYPIVMGGDSAMALVRQLGNHVGVLPYTVVINADGKIIHQQLGEFTTEELLNIISPLLK